MLRERVYFGPYNNKEVSGISLVVYVHGWHHNAHANDGNVRNFRKLLGDVALAEGESNTARRVVGIYVGWRGDSITAGTAIRIG